MKFNKNDFEKIVLGILSIISVLVTLYLTIKGSLSVNISLDLSKFLIGVFVVRKGISYWKPERYDNGEKPKEEKQVDDGFVKMN
jgi:hypothetical protein